MNNLDKSDLLALKQLGMRCLVMLPSGIAFCSEYLLCVNHDKTSWKQAMGHNPRAKCISPEKLNNYFPLKQWQDSLIDLDNLENEVISMKYYTKDEIKKEVQRIWSITPNYPDKIQIEVVEDGYNIVLINEDEYESPTLNLTVVMELSEFFDTKNINDSNEIWKPGCCDTCEYGARSGFTIEIRPER